LLLRQFYDLDAEGIKEIEQTKSSKKVKSMKMRRAVGIRHRTFLAALEFRRLLRRRHQYRSWTTATEHQGQFAPFKRGIARSKSIKSGLSALAVSMASTPSTASCTDSSALRPSSNIRTANRIEALSSATKTVFGMAL
jgi:hypothetical protein